MSAINISTSATIFWWAPAAVLEAAGTDAAVFLQGQFTNDLRQVGINAGVYGLWLSVKGKVMADSFVVAGESREKFWIVSYFSDAAVIRERLESYLIADDVTLEDVTPTWRGVSLFDAPEGRAIEAGFSFHGRRGGSPCVEWMYPVEKEAYVREALRNLKVISAEEMERRRIEASVPRVPLDVGPADLPNEAGLEAAAISYHKGCYLGQEVMARLKTMGQVRRRLVPVEGAGPEVPSLPAPLFVGPRQVGELRSAVRTSSGIRGLAMLSLLHVAAGATVAFVPEGPAGLIVGAPP